MRKIWIFIGCLLVTSLYAENFQQMLEKVDSLVSYTESDFQARYTIVQDIPGEGRVTTVASVFRRDRLETYSMIVEEPVDNRGQGYLKQNNTLWVFDPESRKFNSTSSRDRFQNSNARNSDFTQSTLARDYRVIHGEKVKLGNYNCWLLELEAISDDLSYPKMKIWIDEDFLVRKTEDYSLSGQLLRTTFIPAYHQVEERYVPYKVLFVDQLAGARINGRFVNERTQVTIDNPSLIDLPDSVFSKTFLEQFQP